MSMSHYRDVYFPQTEALDANEMRVTALGTGIPRVRPSQMAASWLVELGNGDKFIFDLGTGSIVNFGQTGVTYVEANKLFLTHLHVDHTADFISWYLGGWNERFAEIGVEVWGPSGPEAHLGTAHCIQGMINACQWDIAARRGKVPEEGLAIAIHEFDYRGMNEVVYERNGVTVRSWPAVHVLDGAVSYSLEWNGLKFVYSGDTVPNKWFLEYAQHADVVIHECFMSVDILANRLNFPRDYAIFLGTKLHTSPEAFGAIMKRIQPRLAIAYHFLNEEATGPEAYQQIRQEYKGQLALAKDLMVWNITPDEIRQRMLVNTPNTWPQIVISDKPGTRGPIYPMSDWLKEGIVTFPGIDEFTDTGYRM